MIEKIVMLYRKTEMGIISGLAGSTAAVIDETSFYDVGYMQTQTNRVKKELQRVTNELKTQFEAKDNSDYGKKHKAELIEQREQLLFHLVFLASNSFANLDSCVRMAEGHNFNFMDCVNSLNLYKSGNKEAAFKKLEAYYREHGSIEGHFLANKVYGLLLTDKRLYRKAIPFLTYALQFIPSDKECLEKLRLCYQQERERGRASVVDEILSVLG